MLSVVATLKKKCFAWGGGGGRKLQKPLFLQCWFQVPNIKLEQIKIATVTTLWTSVFQNNDDGAIIFSTGWAADVPANIFFSFFQFAL